MELTFAFDCQLNDQEDWIATGTKVKTANVWKEYEGSTAVIITEAFNYNGKPIKLQPTVEYFMDVAFQELR